MIDVSQFNEQIHWGLVPKATHALVRVTYGATGVDTRGAENLHASRISGHITGGYHFLEDQPPALQIAQLLSHCTPRPGQFRCMIDVEPSQWSHPTPALVMGAVQTYQRATGHYPILYGPASTLASLHLPAEAGRCPLMLAAWGTNDGREHSPGPLPMPWLQLSAHQYTSKGTCPGIAGNVDVSRIYRLGAMLVPEPRPLIDYWKVSFTDKAGNPASRLTRFPFAWLRLHPMTRYRGPITITPHRKG